MMEIKKCPFCGGDVEIIYNPTQYFRWGCWCKQCRANISGEWHDMVVEAWNKRADDKE